jgi:cbb3-type cytochrome oxidase subunit 3
VLAWVGLARNRPAFDEAARLPFADDTPEAAP